MPVFNRMWRRGLGLAGAIIVLNLTCAAQEASFGIAAPATLTAGALYSGRLQTRNPEASRFAASFRAVSYPTVKLGEHWFGYAALQFTKKPFLYDQANSSRREIEFHLLQAFAGYSRVSKNKALTIKIGQIYSTFGSHPPNYDEAKNWLIDVPHAYGYRNRPVTYVGALAAEIDVSIDRVDARFQVADSSPAIVQSSDSPNQDMQWNAGAGYTIRPGLRAGVSAYRGPFLLPESRSLAVGENPRDFPATGLGFDWQWVVGRWSTGGELQRFSFDFPRAPAAVGKYGYGETKVAITPRLYLAARAGFQAYNYFLKDRQSYEVVVGFRPNRFQLVKVGYEWLRGDGVQGNSENVIGFRLVTSIDALTLAFR